MRVASGCACAGREARHVRDGGRRVPCALAVIGTGGPVQRSKSTITIDRRIRRAMMLSAPFWLFGNAQSRGRRQSVCDAHDPSQLREFVVRRFLHDPEVHARTLSFPIPYTNHAQ
eukprot:204305-Pyramimonas_sp.AAC.1